MIKTFEDYTYELTDYESQTLLAPMVAGLKTKTGKENSITNKQICEAMKLRGYNISDARVRKIISFIRVQGIIPLLIANGKNGYYIASTSEEVEDYIESLHQRERSIKKMRQAMEEQYVQRFKQTSTFGG